MTGLAEEEGWARDCMREALPGCAVDQHDDNSEASMYDLAITYPGGLIGAVEVTAAADRRQLELWKLVGGQGKRWIEQGLAGGWIVRILPSTRAKNLLRQLPDLLRSLERDGLHEVRGDKGRQARLRLAWQPVAVLPRNKRSGSRANASSRGSSGCRL